MSLVTTFAVGRLRCHMLEAGRVRLDGGAMFGIVPRPLWSRHLAPDDRNRVTLALRCLLVEHPDGLILVDTGMGRKEDAVFRDRFGVENAGRLGGTTSWLEDALAALGHGPEDIRLVVNTHLHFDHAGGNTVAVAGNDTAARPAFPNATYLVQRGELEFARRVNERTRASYLPSSFDPVAAADRWRLLEGPGEVAPGVAVRLTPGHTPAHQSVVVTSGGETAIFLADVIPTTAHLPLPWVMGFDVEPLRTLETKRALLAEAARDQWLLLFEHDPAVLGGRTTGGPRAPLTDVMRPGGDA